jgi:hypothetical protein
LRGREDGSAALPVVSPSTEIAWDPEQRLANLGYAKGATLRGPDGDFLVESLRGWIGGQNQPFAVLADAAGLLSR